MPLILISYFAACVALTVRLTRKTSLEERARAAARSRSNAVAPAEPTNPFTIGVWAVLMFCFPVVFVAVLSDNVGKPKGPAPAGEPDTECSDVEKFDSTKLDEIRSEARALTEGGRHDEAAAIWHHIAEPGKGEATSTPHSKQFAKGQVVTGLSKAGRHQEAIELCQTLIESTAATHGPDSSAVAWKKMQLSSVMANAGRHSEAAAWRHEVLVAFTDLYGPDDHKTTSAASWLADSRRAAGLDPEAD